MKNTAPLQVPLAARLRSFFLLHGLVVLLFPGTGIAQSPNSPVPYTEADILAVLHKHGLLDETDVALQVMLTPEEAPLDPQVYQQALADRARHEALIADLETNASRDAFSADLAEAYLGLAGTLDTLRLHEEAIAAYEKALQTVRISNGLNSLEQIPVLEALLANAEKQSNWEDVDNNIHLIAHITRKNFAPGNPRRTTALTRLGTWQIRAAAESLLGGFRSSAQDAATLLTSEVRLLEAMHNREAVRLQLASLYLGEARAKLSLAREIFERPLSDYNAGGASNTITTQRCYAVRLPDGTYRQVCETVEMPNLDFYIDPSNRKYQEISRNLGDTRQAITRAYEELASEADVEEKDALLAQIQLLTDNYNTFVSSNGL